MILGWSATALSTYKRCKVRWFLRYYARLPEVQKTSAALGTEVHAIAERYLIEGKDPPPTKAGAIFAAGKAFNPPPRSGEVEASVAVDAWPDARGKFSGKIDYINTAAKPPIVLDHKTSSDIGRYTLTADELRRDDQTALYAWATLREKAPDEVEIIHIQYQTKGAIIARRVAVRRSWSSIVLAEKALRTLAIQAHDWIDTMENTNTTPTTKDANPSACYDYGRCGMADFCPFFPENRTPFNPTR